MFEPVIHDNEQLTGSVASKSFVRVPIPYETVPSEAAFIDYLGLTIRAEDNVHETLDYLKTVFPLLFGISSEHWNKSKSGWYGYKYRIDLAGSGLLAYGGKSQKNTIHIELTGQGCAKINNWQKVFKWITEKDYTITRTDLAYDDLEGSTVDIKKCIQWRHDGLFNANGRPPRTRHIDDFGSGEGQTLYIGHRSNGKMARMYDKGKEQGDPESKWFRIEVELRNKSRVIPPEILIKPGQYLAGTYKAFEFISIIQDKIKTIQRTGTISYEKQVEWLRTAGGKTINAMLQVEDGDIGTVIDLIRREGLPGRLEPISDYFPEAVK